MILYQINGIRSFSIKSSIARHGDLTLQIKLIGYYAYSTVHTIYSKPILFISICAISVPCQYAKYVDESGISTFELPEKVQQEMTARFCAEADGKIEGIMGQQGLCPIKFISLPSRPHALACGM